jgi:hypothetical protein
VLPHALEQASGMIYIAVADLIPGLHNTGRTYPHRPQALLILESSVGTHVGANLFA